MPTPISTNTPVDINKINEVLDKAAAEIISAKGSDPAISRADIKKKLATLQGEERALVDLLYRFTDHRDAQPHAKVTEPDVKASLSFAKEKLIKRLDKNNDLKLDNQEIGKMSQIGKLAASIARKASAAGPSGGTGAGYGELLDNAIQKGWVTIKETGGKIDSFRVTSDWDSTKPTDMVKAIVDLPNVSNLKSFSLGVINQWDSNDSYGDALKAIADKGPFNKVSSAKIGDFEYPDETEISWVSIGSVANVFTAAPNLTKLEVQGGGIELGTLNSAKLETLKLRTGGLPAEAVQSLDNAILPKLKNLEVWFGSEEYGAGGNIGMIQKLLAGQGYPKLEHLGLQNSEFADDIAKALPNSGILPQLKTLDLSMGTLSQEGAQAIIDNASKFTHLTSLNVDDNFLPEATVNALKAALGNVVKIGKQDKLDPSDPTYRYVSVGE